PRHDVPQRAAAGARRPLRRSGARRAARARHRALHVSRCTPRRAAHRLGTSGMKPRIVVLGIMGRTPFAGVAWQVLHYLEGLRRLGVDVYYVEDTAEWAYDADRETPTDNHSYPVRYVGRLMDWVGLADRWAYRAAGKDGAVFGLSERALDDVFAGADALVNLTGATLLRDEHLRVPTRIYLETDPILPQVEIAQGRRFTIDFLGAHTHHFTFGENLGTPQCPIPVKRFPYVHTRQPVVLDWWKPTEAAA